MKYFQYHCETLYVHSYTLHLVIIRKGCCFGQLALVQKTQLQFQRATWELQKTALLFSGANYIQHLSIGKSGIKMNVLMHGVKENCKNLTVISRIENVHYNTIQMLLLTLLEFKLANYNLVVFYRILLLTSSLLVLILLSVLSH